MTVDPDALGHLQTAFDLAWNDFPKRLLAAFEPDTARQILARAVVQASADGVTGEQTLASEALRRVLGDG